MMTRPAPSSTYPLTAACQLSDAVSAANTLLYYAVSSGQDLPAAICDPIIKARAALDRGETLSEDEEAKFLDAYSKLAVRVSPVTAATLDATSRGRGRRGWVGRLLGLRPVSDAQRLVRIFGFMALGLILCIAVGEWTLTFVRSIAAAEKQFEANSQELREATTRLGSIEDQITLLSPSAEARPDTAAVRQVLKARKDEIEAKRAALRDANQKLSDSIDQGYTTLGQVLLFDRETLKDVSVPLGIILGSFLLPVLYGALGTFAFVLRSLFREMVDRTFDGRRTGEFTVRIFLGMLSGPTLQWLVVGADGTLAGGVSPAVLAFLGGYSVEILFAAVDRLVHLVTGRMRSPNRPGQLATRPKRDPAPAGVSGAKRTRVREIGANGVTAGQGQRAASPVAALAAVRTESN